MLTVCAMSGLLNKFERAVFVVLTILDRFEDGKKEKAKRAQQGRMAELKHWRTQNAQGSATDSIVTYRKH